MGDKLCYGDWPKFDGKISRYSIVCDLAEGSFGWTWLVTDPFRNERVFVLKLLKEKGESGATSIDGFNELSLDERIKLEINKTDMISDFDQVVFAQEFVDCIDSFENNYVGYTMRCVGGLTAKQIKCGNREEILKLIPQSLDDIVNNRDMIPTNSEVRDFAYSLVKGINQAHEKNVLHEDLNKENVLIDKKRIVYIIDWGFDRSTKNALHVRSVERGVYDETSEVYAVGSLIYLYATGFSPCHDGNISREEIKKRKKSGQITKPSELNHNIDPELDELIMKCIAGRGQRYQKSAEHLGDLENFWWKKRFNIVKRYEKKKDFNWAIMTDLIEESLMSLDARLPFDDNDISEGKFPYGRQIGQNDKIGRAHV